MDQNQLNKIQNEVNELKTSVKYNEILLERLDRAIEKMSEVSGNISKLLAVHENKIENQDQTINVLHKRLSELREEIHQSIGRNHSAICGEFEKVKEMIEKQESRLSSIEKWKYGIIISSTIIGFLISKVNLSAIF